MNVSANAAKTLQLTSADFRKQNRVVFEAPILEDSQVEVPGLAGWNVSSADFPNLLDLNRSGDVDFTTRKVYPNGNRQTIDNFITATEPSLVGEDYSDIKVKAGQAKKEVLTQDDLGDVGTDYLQTKYHLSYDEPSYYEQYESTKLQSLSRVTANIAANLPGAVGAQWAIDCNTNSFLVYVPGDRSAN